MTAASGTGLATVTPDGTVLDTWFPEPRLGADGGGAGGSRERLREIAGRDEVRGVRTEVIDVVIDTDAPPATTPDAYLRLHLLSARLALPNEINLDGIFAELPIVAWTTGGPVDPSVLDDRRPLLRRAGFAVTGLDRFPPMLDYVAPSGVRIADASRVRLGAHLAPGTVVMHEGFVNFNAGTLGASMVEGRISQGVVVGDGSDIGGGASIMGTLSGGGRERISIGKRSLLGANSGVGISIGDDCVVEAGLYVTAGTRVTVLAADAAPRVLKAVELSGVAGFLFRRNSQTGAVEALTRTGAGIQLNEALHG